MQVNNSTSPNFKGIYIVKGTARNVERASDMIRRACNSTAVHELLAFEANLSGKTYEAPKQVLRDFTDCLYCYLTNVYDTLQPLVQNLIATNEDTEIISEYLGKSFEDSETGEILNAEEVQALLYETIEKQEEGMDKYESAKEACYRGDSSALADIVVKSQIEAKNNLKEALAPYEIPTSEVPVLNAENIIEAIDEERFDYINGHIYNDTYEIEN